MRAADDIAIFVTAVAGALLLVYGLFLALAGLSRRWGYVDENGKPIGAAADVPGIRGRLRGEQQIVRLLRPAAPYLLVCVVAMSTLRAAIALL